MIATQLDLVAPPGRVPRGTQLAGLRIAGDPVPWARPKPMTIGRGENARITERFQGPFAAWRVKAIREVARFWARRDTLRVPIVAQVVAVFERPDRPPRSTIDGELVPYPWAWTDGRLPSLGMGDVDNIAKAVLDVLQRAPTPLGLEVAWTPVLADDRLVVDLRATRVYAAVGERACTEVRLWSAA